MRHWAWGFGNGEAEITNEYSRITNAIAEIANEYL